ncbi:restriction endonuclease subunit S [Exiguobacterium sp. ERU656]|uniref:restriction endonuclease subunit S n=1 Tax=Exiguobacterium sp. ERU656 TaxID=2751217 RepID=UPI001BEB1F5A|nr:restriction endonuclease subunit S [Exiguobacterium sp. ERU656]
MKSFKLKELVSQVIVGEWGEEANTDLPKVKVIRTTNFTNTGQLNLDKGLVYRHIDSAKVQKKQLKFGDTIIEKSGGSPTQPVGRVVFFDKIEDTYLCNNFTSILRPNTEIVEPKYLFYLLFNLYQQRKVMKYQNNTTGIINLKLDQYLTGTEIIIPNKKIQKKIIEILDSVSILINKRLIELTMLDELAKSVFGEMFSKERNRIFRIKDIADIKTGSTPKRSKADFWTNGTIPWVKTGEVNMNYIHDSKEKITELALKESSLNLFPKNTILIAMYGQGVTRGRVGMLKIPATTNQACAAVIPHEQVNPYFLFKQLEMNYEKIRSLGRGGNQQNLNLSLVGNFEVMIPDIQKQNEYNDFYYKIDKQKIRCKKSLSYFLELRSSLFQKAFQGELFKEE